MAKSDAYNEPISADDASHDEAAAEAEVELNGSDVDVEVAEGEAHVSDHEVDAESAQDEEEPQPEPKRGWLTKMFSRQDTTRQREQEAAAEEDAEQDEGVEEEEEEEEEELSPEAEAVRKRELVQQFVDYINSTAATLNSASLDALLHETKEYGVRLEGWQHGEDEDHEGDMEMTPYEVPKTFVPESELVKADGEKIVNSVDLPPVPSERDHHWCMEDELKKDLALDFKMPWGAVYTQFMKYGVLLELVTSLTPYAAEMEDGDANDNDDSEADYANAWLALYVFYISVVFLFVFGTIKVYGSQAKQLLFYGSLRHGLLVDFQNETGFYNWGFVLTAITSLSGFVFVYLVTSQEEDNDWGGYWKWISAGTVVFFARDPLLDLQEPWHHFDTLEESLIPLPKFVERSPTNAMTFLYHTKVQREAATFDRLSDLINYQREARFLACVKWAEAHGYDNGAEGYSGEKLDGPSDVSDYLKKLDASGTGSTLGWLFSMFNFGLVQKFPLERLIRKNHRNNWQACTDELTDLRHTIEEAPIKFQWNQLATMRTMEADGDTEGLEQENANTCGGWLARFFDCGGDKLHTKAGKLVINTYADSSTQPGQIKAKKLPKSYFRISGFFGIGKYMNAWCELQFRDEALERYSRSLMRKLTRTVECILLFAALYSVYKLELYTIWQEHQDDILAKAGADSLPLPE